MKKFTSIILAVLTVIAIAVPAFAEEAEYEAPEILVEEIITEEPEQAEEAESFEMPEAVEAEEPEELPEIEKEDVYQPETARAAVNESTGINSDTAENEDESLKDFVATMYLCVSGMTGKYWFGHTWICIRNDSDEDIKIGSRVIAPGEMASFGLHHFDGMHYDDEMRDYNNKNVKAEEKKLTRSDLKNAEDEITNSNWHWYEYLTHNCTNFATSVWKKVTGKHYFAFCFPFVVSSQMRNTKSLKIAK